MMDLNTLALFLVPAGIVALALWLAARLNLHSLLLDHPNARSLHAQPTPRYGGVAVVGAAACVMPFIALPAGLRTTLLLALALASVSLIDDRKPLPVVLRLLVQLGAAALAAWQLASMTGSSPHHIASSPNWAASPLGLIVAVSIIAWMTNLFNFMDGADGLAGGMAVVGFAAMAIAAPATTGTTGEATSVAAICCVLSGAAAGFLAFNFPPARVFMGDAGAIPIGFLAATLGIYGMLAGMWPWWFFPLVFSAFIVDASTTLAKRLLRGEKVWQAHREHYYQRLILSGWSHRKTSLSYYFLMLASSISALIAQKGQLQYTIVSFWVITYTSLLLYLEWRLSKKKKVIPEETDRAK
jgi:UDP-N-acetylmuramyl pentapeptide phosphotransferase/UDP-N-acetylglucosamine-1-phosphate transferase